MLPYNRSRCLPGGLAPASGQLSQPVLRVSASRTLDTAGRRAASPSAAPPRCDVPAAIYRSARRAASLRQHHRRTRWRLRAVAGPCTQRNIWRGRRTLQHRQWLRDLPARAGHPLRHPLTTWGNFAHTLANSAIGERAAKPYSGSTSAGMRNVQGRTGKRAREGPAKPPQQGCSGGLAFSGAPPTRVDMRIR
jgi:hypothetical protein